MARFYKCRICGNFVGMIHNAGVPMKCCEELMEAIEPNTNDTAALEKHVPVVKEEDGKVTVTVGSVAHPMTQEHLIEWVYLITDKKRQRVKLRPGDAPVAVFLIEPNEVVLEVNAFCNLHGLWKDND